uniref:Fibroblast growth factor n=1 Tax=Electrophorus electricus TaxID=8005 RepID=A0A4W4DPI9_ELEEL
MPDQRVGEGSVSGRRTGRLYCRVGIGFHLQIHPSGRVNGSHEPNHLSALELFAVSQGVIGIRGVFSNRFLAMNKRGWLHATETFTDDCKFRERFQENSYNTYTSVIHKNRRTGREWFVALNKRGKAKMGSNPRVKAQHKCLKLGQSLKMGQPLKTLNLVFMRDFFYYLAKQHSTYQACQ